MSSDNRDSKVSASRSLLTSLAVFLGFGVLSTFVFCWGSGHVSVQDKAAKGIFDAETVTRRTNAVAEAKLAQAALVDRDAITAAEKAIAASPAASKKAVKTDLVVMGSPTFMKQMKAATAAAEATKKKEEAAKKAVAPKPAAPAVAPKAK